MLSLSTHVSTTQIIHTVYLFYTYKQQHTANIFFSPSASSRMYGEPYLRIQIAHTHRLRTYALRFGSVVQQSTPDNELVNTYKL